MRNLIALVLLSAACSSNGGDLDAAVGGASGVGGASAAAGDGLGASSSAGSQAQAGGAGAGASETEAGAPPETNNGGTAGAPAAAGSGGASTAGGTPAAGAGGTSAGSAGEQAIGGSGNEAGAAGAGGEPAEPACVCDSGPCCDGCNFRPKSFFCGEKIRYSTCREDGARIENDYWNLFCSGTEAAECTRWAVHTRYSVPECGEGLTCVGPDGSASCEP